MSSPLSSSALSDGSSSSWKRTLWFLPFSVLLELVGGVGGANSSFLVDNNVNCCWWLYRLLQVRGIPC